MLPKSVPKYEYCHRCGAVLNPFNGMCPNTAQHSRDDEVARAVRQKEQEMSRKVLRSEISLQEYQDFIRNLE